MDLNCNSEKKKKAAQRNNNKPRKKFKDYTGIISDGGGYFDTTIKPLVDLKDENSICNYLKDNSLLHKTWNCPHSDCESKPMKWQSARIVDKFKWTCLNCNRHQSIKVESFFSAVKCDLKMCLRLILAWCQQLPEDHVALLLETKEHIVRKVYEQCDKVTSAYVKRHADQWMLGGQNKILIVDEFPNGCMSTVSSVNSSSPGKGKKRNNNSHTVLCIAEVNEFPTRMWLHMIQALPEPPKAENFEEREDQGGKSKIVEEAMEQIKQHVIPGSFIIANTKAHSANYENIVQLKQYKVLSVEYLQKFDPPDQQKLLQNLETIWENAVEICMEIQNVSIAKGQEALGTHLWRQQFGSPCDFKDILSHIREFSLKSDCIKV